MKYFGAGYLSVSILTFAFPTFLKSKLTYSLSLFNKAIQGQAIIRIAHRGGPRYCIENTIQAFKFSQPMSDMLEMDVCVTKDGILVVHHDEDLWRTCGVNQKIREVNYANLPDFKRQIELEFSKGEFIQSCRQRIPTLEVFLVFKDIPLNIQLKTPNQESIKQLQQLIHRFNRTDHTVFGVRDTEMQQFMIKQDPNSLYFANDAQTLLIIFCYFTGLLPFVQLGFTSLQLPFYTLEAYEEEIKEKINSKTGKYQLLKTHLFFRMLKVMNFILKPMLWHLRKRGVMTYYWVCNTEKDVERAVKYGACGVMSDDPKMLRKTVKKILAVQQRETFRI